MEQLHLRDDEGQRGWQETQARWAMRYGVPCTAPSGYYGRGTATYVRAKAEDEGDKEGGPAEEPRAAGTL